MHDLPANSLDFILTDPPYLVNYRDRTGRSIQNDVNGNWLRSAIGEAYLVLEQDCVAIMFYSWTKVDAFFASWKSVGFRRGGHIAFRKTYTSKTRFLSYRHEQSGSPRNGFALAANPSFIEGEVTMGIAAASSAANMPKTLCALGHRRDWSSDR